MHVCVCVYVCTCVCVCVRVYVRACAYHSFKIRCKWLKTWPLSCFLQFNPLVSVSISRVWRIVCFCVCVGQSLTLDAAMMSYPPASVCMEGTEAVQRFLCTGERCAPLVGFYLWARARWHICSHICAHSHILYLHISTFCLLKFAPHGLVDDVTHIPSHRRRTFSTVLKTIITTFCLVVIARILVAWAY